MTRLTNHIGVADSGRQVGCDQLGLHKEAGWIDSVELLVSQNVYSDSLNITSLGGGGEGVISE